MSCFGRLGVIKLGVTAAALHGRNPSSSADESTERFAGLVPFLTRSLWMNRSSPAFASWAEADAGEECSSLSLSSNDEDVDEAEDSSAAMFSEASSCAACGVSTVDRCGVEACGEWNWAIGEIDDGGSVEVQTALSN